jgi:hypothetical protein
LNRSASKIPGRENESYRATEFAYQVRQIALPCWEHNSCVLLGRQRLSDYPRERQQTIQLLHQVSYLHAVVSS